MSLPKSVTVITYNTIDTEDIVSYLTNAHGGQAPTEAQVYDEAVHWSTGKWPDQTRNSHIVESVYMAYSAGEKDIRSACLLHPSHGQATA